MAKQKREYGRIGGAVVKQRVVAEALTEAKQGIESMERELRALRIEREGLHLACSRVDAAYRKTLNRLQAYEASRFMWRLAWAFNLVEGH